MSDAADILGRPLTETEEAVLAVHRGLEALVARTDLSPCVEANARHALAATWQIVQSLDLDYQPLPRE